MILRALKQVAELACVLIYFILGARNWLCFDGIRGGPHVVVLHPGMELQEYHFQLSLLWSL